MDPSGTNHQRRGPQIYVHLEFGVSWSAKPPKNREVTYKSRNLQERAPPFPRQVAAPNTNYLAAIHQFQQKQEKQRRHREAHHHAHHHHTHQGTAARAPHETRGARGRETQTQAQVRPDTRPSYERGRSAPPPLGENPWDVNVAHQQQKQSPEVWKALPAPPSQFRLGEDGLPWSAWSWGGDPDAFPQDDEQVSAIESRRTHGRQQTSATISPMGASHYSPMSNLPSQSSRHGLDAQRARELEDLSAAMMTIDNGFENQWWNQGGRETTTLLKEVTAGTMFNEADKIEKENEPETTRPIGWNVASATATPVRADALPFSASAIVSPLSDYMDSPHPAFQNFQRRMSTRSEELFFTDSLPRPRKSES